MSPATWAARTAVDLDLHHLLLTLQVEVRGRASGRVDELEARELEIAHPVVEHCGVGRHGRRVAGGVCAGYGLPLWAIPSMFTGA